MLPGKGEILKVEDVEYLGIIAGGLDDMAR